MVNIDTFFKKGASKEPSGSKKNASTTLNESQSSKNKVTDTINLDSDEDFDQFDSQATSLPKHEDSIAIIDEEPVPKRKAPVVAKSAAPPKRSGQFGSAASSPQKKSKIAKKEALTSTLSLEALLAKIPSVDLDAVHVKENVKFDFRASEQSGATSGITADVDFPEGAPNCLLGLTIVFTGQLPTLERGDAEAIAKRYGARVTKSISSKTSLVVLGEEAGPKKLEKIKELHIKAIDEDGFKQLVSGMPEEGGDNSAAEKARQKLKLQEEAAQREAEEMEKREQEQKEKLIKRQKERGVTAPDSRPVTREEDKLWTVKYAPTSLNHICGNKTSVNKLRTWLSNWASCKKNDFKQPGRDGSGVFRAAMLYGPPGIGKTTAAHLVAKELGYDVLERNASDVRSKSLLNAGVKNALDNTSIVGTLKSRHGGDANQKNFVIIMDEVDGMSGGDRGGVGQMALFCRKTSMPMILICNERNSPKMRPFDRVCLDVQFRRPDVNSIKARLMTIAVREKFQLDPNTIEKLVEATRGDIRQVINLLSTISTTTKKIGHENVQAIAQAWEKNIALKPFDITHKLFDGRIFSDIGSRTFPLYKKMELYFDDFDFTPLMIQENYLNTRPSMLNAGQTHLAAVADAAESLSQGDLVERKIRSSEQLWSLLPFHAIMSAVLPASKVAGQMAGRINFTSWLGQNSKAGKYYRLLQELQYHTRLSTSTDKLGLRMDYMPTLKRRMLDPLLSDGSDAIPDVIQIMDNYYLSKEDWDSIMEFLIGNDKTESLIKKIPTAVKSGFTRKYNAMVHPVAIYKTGSTIAVGGRSKESPDFEDVVDADDEVPPADDEDDTKEDNDFKKDKLIKQGKPKASKKRAAPASKKAPAKKRKS